jgi:hypothetical protein
MNTMDNHIILSCCLYGSVFLFATSLTLINKALLEDKKIPKELYIINGLTMLASGSIVIYNLSHFKSSRV